MIGLVLAGLLSVPMVFFHLGLDVLTGLFIRRDISLWLRATTAIAVVAGGALLAFSVPIWIVAAAAGIVAASLFFMAKRTPLKSGDTVA